MLLAIPFAAGVVYPGVLPHPDKLTEDEKIGLLRDLTAEYATAKELLPRTKRPLEIKADGTWDKKKWQESVQSMGPAARLGDKVQITKVTFEGDKMLLEINHGLRSGGHWYDHVQVGMGGATRPVNQSDANAATGTYIEIVFDKPMENLSADNVKDILKKVLDFDKHSATKLYSETLPPEMQKAIGEKRAVEGMDRDQVLLAMGHPDHKYRETKDGVDLEDWIFGKPPGRVTFVTFGGGKVVKVKEEYAGLGSDTAVQRIATP